VALAAGASVVLETAASAVETSRFVRFFHGPGASSRLSNWRPPFRAGYKAATRVLSFQPLLQSLHRVFEILDTKL
jgi:hypothetical protein